MEQILLSTRPVGSAISRTTLSVSSVGKPEARFGQAISACLMQRLSKTPGSALGRCDPARLNDVS
jgi:hypothetical protein